MVKLVQVADGAERRVALVEEPKLRLLEGVDSVYALVQLAMAEPVSLPELAQRRATGPVLEYDPVYAGTSPWRLLPPIDHPEESARCMVSGTGLTHLGSAQDRHKMHHDGRERLTDSMEMFRAGLEGGRPARGRIGVAPEWFYKGTGNIIRAHGEPLVVPSYAEDGGEEAEIAGIYVIDRAGRPCRIGMSAGNEFSDHVYERQNYLHLAASKLRMCSLGPELALDPAFDSVPGEVWIERGGARIWSKGIASGETEMCHSLENIEHHHSKFDGHRRPGGVHVHFFGAHSLSFGDGLRLADGDMIGIAFEGFGRALRNVVRFAGTADALIAVLPLSDQVAKARR